MLIAFESSNILSIISVSMALEVEEEEVQSQGIGCCVSRDRDS